jgi:hypothetical protein
MNNALTMAAVSGLATADLELAGGLPVYETGVPQRGEQQGRIQG